MNGKMMTLTFLKLYADNIKKLGQFFIPYLHADLFKQEYISFVKGTLMHIWKSANLFVFIQKTIP